MFASAERVEELLAAFAGVSVAAVNGPRETVIVGAAEAVRGAREALKRSGLVAAVPSRCPHAPDSPLVEPILDEFEEFARGFVFETRRIALVSNLTGGRVDVVDAADWRRHLRERVRSRTDRDGRGRGVRGLPRSAPSRCFSRWDARPGTAATRAG